MDKISGKIGLAQCFLGVTNFYAKGALLDVERMGAGAINVF